MTELLLIRRRQSQFNAEQRWPGWGDEVPLTAQGEAEAQALAQRLASERDIKLLALGIARFQRTRLTLEYPA